MARTDLSLCGMGGLSSYKQFALVHAYNLVKHDRETNFAHAQLGHAFHAVVACAVMLVAQVGESEAFRWRAEFGWFFRFTKTPRWHPEQVYLPPKAGDAWVGIPYF